MHMCRLQSSCVVSQEIAREGDGRTFPKSGHEVTVHYVETSISTGSTLHVLPSPLPFDVSQRSPIRFWAFLRCSVHLRCLLRVSSITSILFKHVTAHKRKRNLLSYVTPHVHMLIGSHRSLATRCPIRSSSGWEVPQQLCPTSDLFESIAAAEPHRFNVAGWDEEVATMSLGEKAQLTFMGADKQFEVEVLAVGKQRAQRKCVPQHAS